MLFAFVCLVSPSFKAPAYHTITIKVTNIRKEAAIERILVQTNEFEFCQEAHLWRKLATECIAEYFELNEACHESNIGRNWPKEQIFASKEINQACKESYFNG